MKQELIEKVSELKRRSGTEGAPLIPRGARWWLGLPLVVVGAIAYRFWRR